MIKRFNVHNRPVSPHLVIYSTQISSLFSIWHRITGVSLVSFVVFMALILKIGLSQSSSCCFNIIILLNFTDWIRNFVTLVGLLVFSYHFLNGLRHILWDLGFLLDLKNLSFSAGILIVLVLLILVLNLFN